MAVTFWTKCFALKGKRVVGRQVQLLPLTFDHELKDLVFFTNVGMVLLILMFMILFLLFLTAEPD